MKLTDKILGLVKSIYYGNKETLNSIFILGVSLFIFDFRCPIKYLTGLSCAGCGMTRAFIELFHFNIKNAFWYHPLFPLPIFWGIIFLLKKYINKKIYNGFSVICIVLFLVTYLYRLIFMESDIISFEYESGAIYHFIFGLSCYLCN